MLTQEDFDTLNKYGKDLTKLAKEGKLDPVIGREEEILRLMQILSRRRKNNPALIGEAGVGKTSVVEGLAFRIVNNDVPNALKGRIIFTLDIGHILAGASHKGEFEERLNNVIKILQKSEGQVIAFFDELHTLVKAGGGESSMGAGNILKPALARGEIRCIGSTTLDEYKRDIEKDPALERRFQPILVKEPSQQEAITILRGIKENYSIHHGLSISDEAIIASVVLSSRYIRDRNLPDKAIDLVDEACSSLKLELDSKPREIDSLERRISLLKLSGKNVSDISALQGELNSLVSRWEEEKILLSQIQIAKKGIEDLRHEADKLERMGDLAKSSEIRYCNIITLQKELKEFEQELKSVKRFHRDEITEEDIAQIVQLRTGIPVNKLLSTEKQKLLSMDKTLKAVVIGQDKAVDSVCRSVRRSRAGVGDPNKPVGTFLFVGSSGTGKTELSKSLANFLFDTDKSMIRLDMSEYMEKHSVSKMIGSPPGYAGSEAGGQLTEAVRRNPYCVLLLDEIEKAHPDVMNILLQVLDEGRLTDSQGKVIDFRQAIVIMTSNIGSELAFDQVDNLEEKLTIALRSHLRPEFLNRIDEIVLFNSLKLDDLTKIVELNIKKFIKRINELGINVLYDETVCRALATIGAKDPAFGARPLKRLLQKILEDELGMMILEERVSPGMSVRLEADQVGEIVLRAID